MTAVSLSSSLHALTNSPQPPSSSSSPSSPTFQFSQAARSVMNGATTLRSRPATPVSINVNGVSLDPGPGISYREFLRTWTDTHVSLWLADTKCAHHSSTFKDNDIRGDVILELDPITLKEMGVSSIGDRLRILNAVKSLRHKCSSRMSLGPSGPKVVLNDDTSPPPKLDIAGESLQAPKPDSVEISPSRHRRLDSGRPAPLQLNNTIGQDLPRLVRDSQTLPDSAKTATTIRPLPQPTQNTPSSSSILHAGNSTHPRSNLPPLPPPPRVQPPLPPASISTRTPGSSSRSGQNLLPPAPHTAGRRTPTQTESSSYTNQPLPPAPTNQVLATPSSASPWAGYGLPSDPRPGNVGGGKTPGRSNSPHHGIAGPRPPASQRLPASPAVSHAKNGSLSGLGTPTSAGNKSIASRPSTGPAHPYSSSHGPTLQTPQSTQQAALSPIAESFISGTSTLVTSSPPSGNSSYAVGRGPFQRPTTPSHNANPSLDMLKRKLVKFFLPEEGKSITINVDNCAGGIEVMEKALKKFNKLGGRTHDSESIMDFVESDDSGLSVDGWGVYLDWGQTDGPEKFLTEAELLSICHAAPDDPARDHGLTLSRTGRGKRSKALQRYFGETPPAATSSPTSPLFIGPHLSVGQEDSDGNVLSPGYAAVTFAQNQAGLGAKDLKRASSISILSGLGVKDPERALDPPASPTQTAVPRPRSRPSRKLRNFFGQRPPSELITTHLTEFFPFTEKKVLERTARHSMRRASQWAGNRDSSASFNPQASSSRFSVSSHGSGNRTSTRPSSPILFVKTPSTSRPASEHSTEDPPRLSLSTEDGQSMDLPAEPQPDSDAKLHLLPPVAFPSTESLSDSISSATGGRLSRTVSVASKRMSYITELRSKRDLSDTASMITVDEIIAEVESRRKSMALQDTGSTDELTVVDTEDNLGPGWPSKRLTLKLDDDQEIVIPEEESEDDELDEDVDVDGEDPLPGDDEGGATQAGASVKRAIKWIKGALIGAGSFGSVYLGMDAMSGLLMAVKQVELPTGSAPNEERKKSMLTALEREIELLKGLQHENIVQYLYSSTDETHLNIFLEYVPGGSVTALLRNYGAFEEALVRNFVRQILQGLDYLHERDIIHRDIKGANILVDNKGGIKISDFGISKKVEDSNLLTGNRAHRPSLQGSVFWMAPEVVKQTAYTRKADIWSVGCLVVEMLTGEHPWAQLTQMQAIFKIGSSAKPTIPSDISTDAENFLQRTFEINHEARPSSRELLQHPWIAQDPANPAARNKPPKTSPVADVAA